MTRNVVVRVDADGELSIQDELFVPVDGVTRQALPVSGGVIEIDARSPARGMRALIDDEAAAAWWVPFVFGREAAEALDDLASLDHGSARTVRAEIAPAVDLALTVPQLLVGFWYRRWWPAGVIDAPLSEWLIDAELGALAAEAEVVFGGPEIASALLSGHLVRLADEAGRPFDSDGRMLTPERTEAVERAVLAAADVADDTAAGFDALIAVARSVDATNASDSGAPAADDEPDDPVGLADLGGREGPKGFEGAVGHPVDWTAVHPRQLSSSTDAVRTVLREEDGTTVIDISVDAAAGIASLPVEAGELFAIVGEGPFAETTILRASGGRFVGSIEHATLAVGDVRVASDVYGTVARSSDPEAAASVRAIVLDVVRSRITADDPGGIPRFAFERQLVRDAGARIRDRIVAEESADLDLHWLLLTETSLVHRDGAGSAAFSAVDESTRVRIVVSRHARGWTVRTDSLGHDGTLSVRIRFASGTEVAVELDVELDGLADAVLETMADDIPISVRVESLPR